LIDALRGGELGSGLITGETQMGEIAQFIAMPFDLASDGAHVAGEAFKCATPAAAVERAKGFWQILGHAGAIAFVRKGYPEAEITVLRTFGAVPDKLPSIE
jgi:hypothetical protein